MLHHEFDHLLATETANLKELTTRRDELEHEEKTLMRAHYADAVPLTVVKSEQDRIAAELDQITHHSTLSIMTTPKRASTSGWS